jgi:U3 small nucleolar RNA-associated protein 14
MEKEIDALIKGGGLDEKQIQEREELQLQKLSPEEAKRRRTELRAMRELLFRDELKQKRLKKIKSKRYV